MLRVYLPLADLIGLGLFGRQISFKQLLRDVKVAWDAMLSSSRIEEEPTIETEVVADLPRFVRKDAHLPLVLRRVKENVGRHSW